MASALKEMIGKQISVITCDGRNIVGTLRGYDQVTNVILEECHERVYSLDAGVEQVALGLYIIRGDNIAIIGEIDPERDAKTDPSRRSGRTAMTGSPNGCAFRVPVASMASMWGDPRVPRVQNGAEVPVCYRRR